MLRTTSKNMKHSKNLKHLKDQTFYYIITLYYINYRRKLLILHTYYLTHKISSVYLLVYSKGNPERRLTLFIF